MNSITKNYATVVNDLAAEYGIACVDLFNTMQEDENWRLFLEPFVMRCRLAERARNRKLNNL